MTHEEMCEAWLKTKNRAYKRIYRKRYKYEWEIDFVDRINFLSGIRRRPTKMDFIDEYANFYCEMQDRYGECDED